MGGTYGTTLLETTSSHPNINSDPSNGNRVVSGDNDNRRESYADSSGLIFDEAVQDSAFNDNETQSDNSSRDGHDKRKDPSIAPSNGRSLLLELPAELFGAVISYVYPILPNGRPERKLPLDPTGQVRVNTSEDGQNQWRVQLYGDHQSYRLQRGPSKALAILLTCRKIHQMACVFTHTTIGWQIVSSRTHDDFNFKLRLQQPDITASQLQNPRFVRGSVMEIQQFLQKCHAIFKEVQLDRLRLAVECNPFSIVPARTSIACGPRGCRISQSRRGIPVYKQSRTLTCLENCWQLVRESEQLQTLDLLLHRLDPGEDSTDNEGISELQKSEWHKMRLALERDLTSHIARRTLEHEIHLELHKEEEPEIRLTFKKVRGSLARVDDQHQ